MSNTSCPPGQCELERIGKEINDYVFEHHKNFLYTELKNKYPNVHFACLQKIYAEVLQETGSYLLGELYAHTFAKIEADKRSSI